MVLQAGPQLGITAVSQKLFLKTPLAMISTWDGDETGLAQFCRQALEVLR